jgi:hypothetical protein
MELNCSFRNTGPTRRPHRSRRSLTDGYQLCRLLRKPPDFRETPILLVSGHDGFVDRVRGRLAGIYTGGTLPALSVSAAVLEDRVNAALGGARIWPEAGRPTCKNPLRRLPLLPRCCRAEMQARSQHKRR